MRCLRLKGLRVAVTRIVSTDWIYLLGGLALLYHAVASFVTGRTELFLADVERSNEPVKFWFSVFLSGALGLAGLLIIARDIF